MCTFFILQSQKNPILFTAVTIRLLNTVGKNLQLRFTKCITNLSNRAASSRDNKARATLMINFETIQKPKKIAPFFHYIFIFVLYLLLLRYRNFSFLYRIHLLPLVSTGCASELAPARNFFAVPYSTGHANFAIESSTEKGSRLHFDRRGITVAHASRRRGIFGARRDGRRLK